MPSHFLEFTDRLREKYGSRIDSVTETPDGTVTVVFRRQENGDYHFVLTLFNDNEAVLEACFDSEEPLESWYVAYEIAQFKSINDIEKRIEHDLEKTIDIKTKIACKKGMIFTKFCCLHLKDGGYQLLSCNSYFNFGNFSLPEKSIVWYSKNVEARKTDE